MPKFQSRGALAVLAALLYLSLVVSSLSAEPLDAGRFFPDLYPRLEEGLELVDEQKELPESAWFRKDKAEQQEEINELLDEAVRALELPEVREYRKQIADAEEALRESQEKIAEYRRLRVAAPRDAVLGMDQLPLYVTKKGYEEKIEEEFQKVEELSEEIARTQQDFLDQVQRVGIELSPEQFETLLSTVNGDDFLDMAIAFESIRGLTEHLQKLTRESGEDVKTARRYYGMYTVLLRILDFMQRSFLEEIEEEHLPQLRVFEVAARDNIEEAREAIRSGGDEAVLEQNIESNKLTIEALHLYRSYLKKQRKQILERNKQIQAQILTADNTYNTVRLASEVVSLLQRGIKNFEALNRLEPPDLAQFESKELQREFAKLTELMRRRR